MISFVKLSIFFLLENGYISLDYQVTVEPFKKKTFNRPVFHSGEPYHTERITFSPGSRRLCALSTVTVIGWRAGSLAARSFWDLPESLIFQSSSSQCASHWHSRRGEETAWPPYPFQGGFVIMISLHFPSLLVMRNESSFGEKASDCSTGGLFLLLFFLPLFFLLVLLLIVGMRGTVKLFTG